MRLEWEDGRAVGPDGTIYVLQSETVRYEGTMWSVYVYDPGQPTTRPSRELHPDRWPPTKEKARACAHRDADQKVREQAEV